MINAYDIESVAGGFDHSVEADIAEIRNLLAGYAGEASLLKELIQNAEDAGAKELSLHLVPGDPLAPHALLQTPALIVINDGKFEPAHFQAMKRASLGSKAADAKSIGRFGKGLKSVFSICESFFIFAQTDRALGWETGQRFYLLNPWSQQRQPWIDEAGQKREAITTYLIQRFRAMEAPESPRLGLWLPLRQRRTGAEGSYIRNLFPDDEGDFLRSLRQALEALAPDLVLLRKLETISLWSEEKQVASLTFGSEAQRMPDPESNGGRVRGVIIASHAEGQRNLVYTIHAKQAEESFRDLSESPDWPKVISYDANGVASYDKEDKGIPQVALALVRNPAQAKRPTFRTDWAVFLPVRDQLDDEPISLNNSEGDSFSLFLHAYAFLDAQRTRIDGLDANFLGDAPDAQTAIKRKWNERLIRKVLLPGIPELLQASLAVQGGMLTGQELGELVRAFRESQTWQTFRREICDTHQLLQELTPEGLHWVATKKPIVRLPAFENPDRLFSTFPGLQRLREHVTLSTHASYDASVLTCTEAARPDEAQILTILETVQGSLDANARRWVHDLLPASDSYDVLGREPAWAEVARGLPLFKVLDDSPGSQPAKVEYWSVNRILEEGSVFANDAESYARLAAARSALPEWQPKFCDRLPGWTRASVRALSLENLAGCVLSETLAENVEDRKELLKLLKPCHAETAVKAVRYLVHGDSAHSEESDILLIQGLNDDPLIYKAFQSALPEGRRWSLVSEVWSEDFVLPIDQRRFRIQPIAARSLTELFDEQIDELGNVSFPESWREQEYERLLELILRSDALDAASRREVVRRLPIHIPLGESRAPVVLENAIGEDQGFVLDAPAFRSDERRSISESLWDVALGECRIIQLAQEPGAQGYQRGLFQFEDETRELGWPVLAEACLKASSPERFATIIATALVRGSLGGRINQLLKSTPWLPLVDGSVVRPEQMVDLGCANEIVAQLFGNDSGKTDATGVIYVSEQILPELLEIPGFKGIYCNNICHKDRAALKHLFGLTERREDLRMGLAQDHLPKDLRAFLHRLKNIDDLPAAQLIGSLLAVKETPEWQQTVLSEEATLENPVFRTFTEPQRLLSLLKQLSECANEDTLDAYLRAFVEASCSPELLAGIQLQSMLGQWRPAESLVWPSHGIVDEVQLCERQAEILKKLQKESVAAASLAEGESAEGDYLDNEGLKKCLEPVCAELGSDVAAAFVAILGCKDGRDELVKELLSSNTKYDTVDDFRRFLVDETHDGYDLITQMSVHRYRFNRVEGESVILKSITGSDLAISMSKHPDSLIVGDPARLFFQNTPIVLSTRLDVLDRDQLLSAVIKAADTIILRRVLNSVYRDRPPSVRRACEVLAKMRPDLRQAQIEIKLSLAERMRMLRISESSQLFREAERFDECVQLATAAEMDREANRGSLAESKEAKARSIRKRTAEKVVQILRGRLIKA